MRACERISDQSLKERWPMANRKTQPNRLTKALLETADDMRRAGVMDAATHAKITLRHLGEKADVVAEPMTGEEIRKLREQAHLSQAIFARYLNLTVGYVSQLEWGAKRPSGPALVLLNVIRREGIEAIL
jgi:putative transcriptional regulator